MRIINWNIRQGGGRRQKEIVEAIAAHKIDVAVLPEHRNNDRGADLKDRLNDIGLLYQESPESDGDQNSVLIASKTPFFPSLFEDELADTDYGDLSHRCILAGFPNLDLFGFYFPNTKDKAKRGLYDFIFQQTPEFISGDSLLVGDFNTGIHYVDEPKNSLLCSFEFQALETKYGWGDAWRSRNKKVKEFSWFSPQKGNGYRFDHIFSTPSLDAKIVSISYSQKEREEGLSDHSPMIVELDI